MVKWQAVQAAKHAMASGEGLTEAAESCGDVIGDARAPSPPRIQKCGHKQLCAGSIISILQIDPQGQCDSLAYPLN